MYLLSNYSKLCVHGDFRPRFYVRCCENSRRRADVAAASTSCYVMFFFGAHGCQWGGKRWGTASCTFFQRGRLPQNVIIYGFHTITLCTFCLSLSVCLHFPGRPGLAGTRMSPFWIILDLRMMEVLVATGAISRAKLQSNCHRQQTNSQLFTGRMPFLSPN